jgi:hypothetical protein
MAAMRRDHRAPADLSPDEEEHHETEKKTINLRIIDENTKLPELTRDQLEELFR